MTRTRHLLGLAAACLLALPAVAQAPPAPDPNDPDAVLVEELVVTARDRGPAWWRVSDGDSTVYVLGVPSNMPKSFAWDDAVLERRLTGANRVILPFNNVGVGVLGAPGVLFDLARMKSKTPIEETLDPALRARFVAARTRVGQPAKRYALKNGLAAGILLVSDYREAAHITAADPAKTIARLAKARKLKIETKVYPLGPIMGAALRTSPAAQRACLDDALDEVEAGEGSARRAAQAWAEGEVRAALGGERGYEKCLNAAPGAGDLDARLKADQAGAIAAALKQPGHAVAVVQLRPLLAQGGVLDRLRAQGFTVKTPGEE
ncbi:TraB/GumN family protein [Phenylobacterium aquaticum]|uniref:TraB/GumN family protein n=1 Tax=Phenylobacterium aquaticum TaxID=1763816 RepID=UPI0026EA629B|nr:TraB/GumN family protein [Phenylobacterium aquaticum]